MDEQQITALRAALHNWIDHATVEQLERINQIVAADTWQLDLDQVVRQELPYSDHDITPYPSRRNRDNERRRKRALWLAQLNQLKLENATPEDLAEWKATNPEPLHDADLMICSRCGAQISRLSEDCPVCGEKT